MFFHAFMIYLSNTYRRPGGRLVEVAEDHVWATAQEEEWSSGDADDRASEVEPGELQLP